jgi:hypothetical protein
MIVLVDVSASMGTVNAGQSILSAAKAQLGNVVRRMPPSLRLGLIAYSDRREAELAPSPERGRFMAALNDAKVVPRPTRILPALELAYDMLKNQPRGKRSILIVTDNAASQWASAAEKVKGLPAYDPNTAVTVWEPAPPVRNNGVSGAALQLSEEGTLKGTFSVHGANAVPWQVRLNDRVVDRGTLALGRNASASSPFQAALPEGGFYAGEVRLPDDAGAFDDAYYLAGRVPKGFRLLIVDGEGGLAPSEAESYYVRSALESPRDPRLESIQVVRPEGLAAENLDKVDALILANTGRLDEQRARIAAWVENGGGVFLSAGGRWPSPPDAPAGLLRLRQKRPYTGVVAPPEKNVPFLSGVPGLDAFQWDQIKVQQVVDVEMGNGLTPLLRLADGTPLLVHRRMGKGNVLALLTSIDRAWTNFPAKPAFAPLMRELISALADPLREQTSLMGFVDQPIRFRIPNEVRSVTVFSPDGSSAGVKVSKEGILEWDAPPLPGLYTVKTDNAGSDFRFAVNIRDLDEEGDARRMEEGELDDIFPDANVTLVAATTSQESGVLAAIQGRDITSGLLLALLIALLLETVLSNGWWDRGAPLWRRTRA